MLHIDLYIGVTITGAWNVAALSGGFVAIVMVLILLVVILVVTITKKRKSNANLSMYHLYLVLILCFGSANGLPTAPVDPVYEEVGLAMTPRAQDPTNKAYGQVRKYKDCVMIILPHTDGKTKHDFAIDPESGIWRNQIHDLRTDLLLFINVLTINPLTVGFLINSEVKCL